MASIALACNAQFMFELRQAGEYTSFGKNLFVNSALSLTLKHIFQCVCVCIDLTPYIIPICIFHNDVNDL